MNRSAIVIVTAVVCLLPAAGPLLWSAAMPPEPWQQLYTGDDATASSVIGLWQFLPGQETRDNSGHGQDLTLRGQARCVTLGPFGGALESFRAGTDNDRPQGAIAKDADARGPTTRYGSVNNPTL